MVFCTGGQRLLVGAVWCYLKMSVVKLFHGTNGVDFSRVNGSLAADAASPSGRLVLDCMHGPSHLHASGKHPKFDSSIPDRAGALCRRQAQQFHFSSSLKCENAFEFFFYPTVHKAALYPCFLTARPLSEVCFFFFPLSPLQMNGIFLSRLVF